MSSNPTDLNLHEAMKELAPPIAMEGKWSLVGERTHRVRRRGRVTRTISLAAATLAIAAVAYWGYAELGSGPAFLRIDNGAVIGDSGFTGTKPDLAEDLRTAWREVLLEGLWAGNIDALPEHPASLPSEFYSRPGNAFALPGEVELPWDRWRPLWVFGNELSAADVVAAFQAQAGSRPFIGVSAASRALEDGSSFGRGQYGPL